LKYIIGNYFDLKVPKCDGIITDPSWKGVFKKKLGEDKLNVYKMMKYFDNNTIKDSFLIIFTNIQFGFDLFNASKETKWKFHTYQIWDKRPNRTWISWGKPLREVELIYYFKKGNYKFSFKDGTVKPAYKRGNFGGVMKNTTKMNKKVSYGMYSQIINFRVVSKKERVHPYQKPKDFSDMFLQITGDVPVTDPFAGSGSLVSAYSNSIAIDMYDWLGIGFNWATIKSQPPIKLNPKRIDYYLK
jgi:hypothetical protein